MRADVPRVPALTDVQLRLRGVFNRHSSAFEYGTHDCVCLARDAVEAVSGKRLRIGEWENEDEARREIAARGGLLAAIIDVLGMPNASALNDGDIALVVPPMGEPMCGVWAAGRVVIRSYKNGLLRIPARWVTHSWSSA